ncbi:MAG TPA: fluoride efflux transporter CrcB [Naasia sp.]
MIALLAVLAGGVGAGARFLVDGWARQLAGRRYPIGTLLVNATGSLLIGLLAGFAGNVAPEEWRIILGTGFLGGYTTFSAAAVEVVELLGAHRYAAAAAHAVGMLALCTALAAAGWVVGTAS